MAAIPATLLLLVSKLWRTASKKRAAPVNGCAEGGAGLVRGVPPLRPLDPRHEAMRRASERWGWAAVYTHTAATAGRVARGSP
ncbi:MAG TPA: hypothetical protein VKW76_04620 [Candidatus Binatia bacterium]|nr:hypothetical protein [Candidatus Binatia bacterium]